MSIWDLLIRNSTASVGSVQDLRSELRIGRRSQFARSSSLEERIEAMEDESAQLKLILAGAVQLLLSKGVFSADELIDQARLTRSTARLTENSAGRSRRTEK